MTHKLNRILGNILDKAHLCPEGYYCPLGTGAKSAEGNSTGETFEHVPIPCPEGSFGSVQGLAIVEQCSPCPAGFYCPTPGKESKDSPCVMILGHFLEDILRVGVVR